MFDKKIDPAKVREYLKNCGPNTKVYLGCDSERVRVHGKWYADYITVVVVHIDGCKGAKIFGAVEREADYDQRKDRPIIRLMNEAYKIAELFTSMKPIFVDFEDQLIDDYGIDAVNFKFEIHLDLNPDEMHGSSCAVNQAIGYIRGTCNVTPMVKPDAFAASYAADRYKSVMQPQVGSRRAFKRKAA